MVWSAQRELRAVTKVVVVTVRKKEKREAISELVNVYEFPRLFFRRISFRFSFESE